ncbi:hypothetical protein [Sphingomonas corticis]|uniref:Uncharacterized protein n=1 Tax=Sphingomonas corticis TaxID=2722791 RepID=A0ABX1CP15_9SPHN|nr:hypothetical protein [Sphingomonas corticis]NJR79693.1 hypothetical protein [Sphingomonas corticis]
MSRFARSSFLWQFAGGFLLGTMGMGALYVSHDAPPSTPAAIYAQR